MLISPNKRVSVGESVEKSVFLTLLLTKIPPLCWKAGKSTQHIWTGSGSHGYLN
jgi:hypothetical protein